MHLFVEQYLLMYMVHSAMLFIRFIGVPLKRRKIIHCKTNQLL